MLSRNDGHPRRIAGKLEWPIAILFATIPLLATVAVVKNVVIA